MCLIEEDDILINAHNRARASDGPFRHNYFSVVQGSPHSARAALGKWHPSLFLSLIVRVPHINLWDHFGLGGEITYSNWTLKDRHYIFNGLTFP